MPRTAKVRSKRHEAAATLPSKRAFAVPEAHVAETVLPGSDLDATLEQDDVAGPSKSHSKPFSAAPPLSSHPYSVSRSHRRREQRKSRSQIAGGLVQVATALSEAVGLPLVDPAKEEAKNAKERWEEKQRLKVEQKKREEASKMGQGKGRTLSEGKRRKQIALEAQRMPAVMGHPAFKADPWAAIRQHAGNSLAMQDK